MIAKDSGTGQSFIGLASYLATGKGGEQAERVVWSEGVNLLTDDIQAGACQMRSTAGENMRVDHPVWHFSINWHPHEGGGVTKDLAMGIVRSTLDELGLIDHQVMVVAHDDTQHFHVHVMVNRIHPDTHKSWKQGLSKIALEQAMARLSIEHGFEVVPGPHNARDLGMDAPGPDETTPSEAQRYEDRTGADSDLTVARERLADVVSDATSWADLERLAATAGYKFEAAGRGMVFRAADGNFIKASAVSRDASRTALESRFGQTLQDFRESAGAAIDNERTGDRKKSRQHEAAPDPQVADRRRPDQKETIRLALAAATNWLDAETRLGKAGFQIKSKGRGIVIEGGGAVFKASDLGREFSKRGLEQRFNQRFSDHLKTAPLRRPAVDSARAAEIDRAVRALQTFETGTKTLIARLGTRDRALRSTEPTFQMLAEIGRNKRAIEAMFTSAFDKPDKARAAFEKIREKRGFRAAVNTLRDDPTKLGAVRGFALPFANADRKAALAAIREGAGRADAYIQGVAQLRDHQGTIEADKRTRQRWKADPEIDRLRDQVGKNIDDNKNRRIGLERRIIDLSAGIRAEDLQGLPIGSPLRQASVASTVDRLRTEAGSRRRGAAHSEPMPPLTAGPRDQEGFEAARTYSRARAAYDFALFKNPDRARPVGHETMSRLETAAGTLANERPEGVKYLSRFGRGRADLATDLSERQLRSSSQTMARRLDKLKTKLRQTGQGVGAVLSLLRRI